MSLFVRTDTISLFRDLFQLRDEAALQALGAGTVVHIQVSVKQKLAVITLSFPTLLPSESYQQIHSAIRALGTEPLSIEVHFTYEEPQRNQQSLAAYKEICVEDVCGTDIMALNELKSAVWQLGAEGITILLLSGIAKQHTERRGYDRAIQKWLRQVLMVDANITFSLDEQAQEKTDVIRQKALEEQSMILQQIETAIAEEETRSQLKVEASPGPDKLTVGRPIDGPFTPISSIGDEMRKVAVRGKVFAMETRELASGRTLFQFNVTDLADSIMVKIFAKEGKGVDDLSPLRNGMWVEIQGSVQFDTFAKELVLIAQDLFETVGVTRHDRTDNKRVELHAHTQMSPLDGVVSVSALVSQAAKWGHPAIAITDHGVAQSFPEAYSTAKKAGIQCILGLEAYVVDDGVPIVYQVDESSNCKLNEETVYVVFDTETTGLNAAENTLIEIAAVKMRGLEIMEEWTTLIDPEKEISAKITELTGITNEMVQGQPKLSEALYSFRDFVGDAILVAHNAEFDLGFISSCAARIGMDKWTQPVLDTLPLARKLYPNEKNYRLKTLANKMGVQLVNHHRALADTVATAQVFQHMLKALKERGIGWLTELNEQNDEVDYSKIRPFHATILVQNQTGLKNLYRIISESHTRYFHRVPRVPRSLLIRYREGLLVGTACQQGELFSGILRGKNKQDLTEIAKFYDYLEIQPLLHYKGLVRNESISSIQVVQEYHKQILEIGKELEKPVVATGDVHFLHPEDAVFREVFLQSQGNDDAKDQPPLFFMTTEEMLEAFSYLGEDAQDVVIHQPQKIAQLCEDVNPIPDRLYTPVIEGADDEIRAMCYTRARELYGESLPEIVENRLEKELHSIITHGFSVIYLISSKLVKKSLEDGYLVGSRGSVGSSLVATFSDITEVNPLPPHYLCPSCKHSEFIADGSVGSGYDLPDKECPHCQTTMKGDGQDIPFETFLGFKGDKVPDIDLNFSGEYQPRAHKYTQELFGKDYVYRAGTIATVAEKTAFGYVKKFAEERGLTLRNAEIARLVEGCTGIKRTTGQHPGGIIVVPNYKDIYDFTPIQFPADDKNSEWRTTHFDFHSIHDNLLKLDILGHDDPTVIRMLQDLTGVDPKQIPVNDPKVMSLFSGTSAIGVDPQQIRSKTATYGIPEFGTKFVRQMLEATKPKTFSELLQISGLSHGTDVWLNNAQELIQKGTCQLSDVIGCRDDIMVYLIYKGLEPSRAFKIMESVRKGKGVPEEDEAYMKEFNVPDWYIWSCKQIKYMFPKAHAAAYVLMAVRISWFKVYYPLEYYATYFSVRADDFDIDIMRKGYAAILKKVEDIESKGMTATPKEKSLLTVLEMALEMTARGYHFKGLDLYRSDALRFTVDGNALLPPFSAVAGLGENAAKNIAEARNHGEFLSVEDFQQRARLSKTVIELLDGFGCFEGIPETNQLSLF